MLNIIFGKCFFSKCWLRQIAEFCGFKANFCACLDPKYSSKYIPSISSLMEKLILVETSHKNCWIHPWSNKRFIIQQAQMFISVGANFADIDLQGMRDRRMRSGTELARVIQLTDW